MSARYNFIVQITREKCLAHGDNAIANFLSCSGSQRDKSVKTIRVSFDNANKAFGPATREVSLHFEHFEAPVL